MNLAPALLIFVAALVVRAPILAAASPSSAGLLEPYVRKHELAGAVALVADRDRVLSVEAVGLFSTAQDTARYCQMLLNRGVWNGRRYLSEAAFQELTKRQTPTSVKEGYGFGLAVGNGWFGHGGAQSTNMEIRQDKGIVIIWMVQHGGFPGDGGKAQGMFKDWAVERFGK